MSKYHIKKDGTPGLCRANKGNCPGGEKNHFSNQEAAYEASQRDLENEYNVVPENKEEKTILKDYEIRELKDRLKVAKGARSTLAYLNDTISGIVERESGRIAGVNVSNVSALEEHFSQEEINTKLNLGSRGGYTPIAIDYAE